MTLSHHPLTLMGRMVGREPLHPFCLFGEMAFLVPACAGGIAKRVGIVHFFSLFLVWVFHGYPELRF